MLHDDYISNLNMATKFNLKEAIKIERNTSNIN